MNDHFTESKHDCLLFTLFMFVSSAERCSLENFSGSWCVIVVNF
jgi:hypothetical protein